MATFSEVKVDGAAGMSLLTLVVNTPVCAEKVMNRSFPPGGLIEVLRTVTNGGFGPEVPVENTNWFTSLEAAAAFSAPCARTTVADTTTRNSKLSTFLIFLSSFFGVMLTGLDCLASPPGKRCLNF